MGTQALTRVYDERQQQLVDIHRQFDGYVQAHGADLVVLLKDMHVVNGMAMNDTRKLANGADCLAAQIIAMLKDEPGNIYVRAPGMSPIDLYDYVYDVYAAPGEPITLKVLEYGTCIFDGTADDFRWWAM